MEKVEKLLEANKPIWAKFAVIETSGLLNISLLYFESEPFLNPFNGKYLPAKGRYEVIDITNCKNILFEI